MRSPKLRLLMVVAGSVLSIMSPTLARQSDTSTWTSGRRLSAAVLTTTSWLPVPRLVTTTTAAVTPAVTAEATVPVPAPTVATADGAVAYALAQLGRPYRFGTSGPATFDCSGLTRAAYRRVGIDLPHHARSQARLGTAVPWQTDGVGAGDLVFVAGGRPRRALGHVGIAVSATEWVEAPAPGRVVRREPIPFARVQAVRRIVPG